VGKIRTRLQGRPRKSPGRGSLSLDKKSIPVMKAPKKEKLRTKKGITKEWPTPENQAPAPIRGKRQGKKSGLQTAEKEGYGACPVISVTFHRS